MRAKAVPRRNPHSPDVHAMRARLRTVGRWNDRAKLRYRRMVFKGALDVSRFMKRKKADHRLVGMANRLVVQTLDGFVNSHNRKRDGLLDMLWKGMFFAYRNPGEKSQYMSVAHHIDKFPNRVTLALFTESFDPLLNMLGETYETPVGEMLLVFRNELLDTMFPRIFKKIKRGLTEHLQKVMGDFVTKKIKQLEEKKLADLANRPLTRAERKRRGLLVGYMTRSRTCLRTACDA
jgi:hypothetical protein